MQGNISAADMRCLAPNRSWVLQVMNQVCSSCGIGLCDSVLCNFVRGAEAWMYDTVFFRWALAANGAPLTLDAGQSRELYSNAGGGNGGTILGGWGQTKNLNYSDLLDGGTPVDRGFMQVVCGAAIRIGLPFQQSVPQSANSAQFYSDWMSPQHDGATYSQRLQALTAEATALQLKLGDTGCTYYLGMTHLFSSHIGAYGPGMVTNGSVNIPGAYMPFMVCFCVGSQFDLRRAVVIATVGSNMAIESNGPVPTALPVNGDVTGPSGTVYISYTAIFFGYPIIFDTASYSGGLSIEEQVILKRFIAQQGLAQLAA